MKPTKIAGGKTRGAAPGRALGSPYQEGLPLLLLVHGAGLSRECWPRAGWDWAAGRANILAVDLPGHGQNDAGEGLASIAAHAGWLAGLIGELGGPVAVVGHSMGAAIALSLAASHPETVSALALLGITPRMKVSPHLLELLENDPVAGVDFILAHAFSPQGRQGAPAESFEKERLELRSLFLTCAPDVLLRDFRACDGFEGGSLAGRVRCPTLVVAGGHDRMTPADQGRELAAAIAGATFLEISSSGHMILQERPKKIFTALEEFLGKHLWNNV
ncbi:MAG: alpha/beta hydrolase [Deltaproteobacteria bacterium]|nr:alpha/beta hydrolase [Deltaproteobacteria bacterium]